VICIMIVHSANSNRILQAGITRKYIEVEKPEKHHLHHSAPAEQQAVAPGHQQAVAPGHQQVVAPGHPGITIIPASPWSPVPAVVSKV
jgi:hypothetical protein